MTYSRVSEEHAKFVAGVVAEIAKGLVEDYGIQVDDLVVGPTAVVHTPTRIEFHVMEQRRGGFGRLSGTFNGRLYAYLGSYGNNDSTYWYRKDSGFDVDGATIEMSNMIQREISKREYADRHAKAYERAEQVFAGIFAKYGDRLPLGPYGWSDHTTVRVGGFHVQSKIQLVGEDMDPALTLRIHALTTDQVKDLLQFLRDM